MVKMGMLRQRGAEEGTRSHEDGKVLPMYNADVSTYCRCAAGAAVEDMEGAGLCPSRLAGKVMACCAGGKACFLSLVSRLTQEVQQLLV